MDHLQALLEKSLNISKNQADSNKTQIFKDFENTLKEMPDSQRKNWEKDLLRSRNLEKLSLVKKYFQWTPLDATIRNKYTKDVNVSTCFSDFGSTAYENERFLEAVRSYNLAILFAVPSESNLALVYSQRSAALHSMGLTEEAIKDLTRAISNNFHNEPDFMENLESRKSNLEALLDERMKSQSLEKPSADDPAKLKSFYEQMFSLETPNPLAPSLDQSIDIKYSSKRGRHLVANRDIPIGTTVLLEKPKVTTLESALTWDVDHCHHCMKKNLQCISCPDCVFTQYCNENCLAEAHEYHQYECPCLPELHCVLEDDMEENFHLIFKLICMVGPKELFKIFNKQKGGKSNLLASVSSKTFIAGSDPETRIYDPYSYRAIYNLARSTVYPKGRYYYLLLSLILSRTLQTNSKFFDSIGDNAQTEEFLDFIAEQILRHFTTFRVNVFSVGGIAQMDGATYRTFKMEHLLNFSLERIASGLFPTACLINHSCDQNVLRFTADSFGTMAIVALRSLKKGQELLMTYGPVYGNQVKEEQSSKLRQVILDAYEFTCNCNACKYDWPPVSDLLQVKPKFCCPSCASKFSHENKMSPEFVKTNLVTQGLKFKCKSCKKQYDKESMNTEYTKLCKTLDVCISLIESKYPLTAISSLKSSLQVLENTVAIPNYLFFRMSKFYRIALHHIIFYANLHL